MRDDPVTRENTAHPERVQIPPNDVLQTLHRQEVLWGLNRKKSMGKVNTQGRPHAVTKNVIEAVQGRTLETVTWDYCLREMFQNYNC